MSPFTRRNFLKGIGAAAGSSFFLSTARSYAQIVAVQMSGFGSAWPG